MIFTLRRDLVRVISARPMSRKERTLYAKTSHEAPYVDPDVPLRRRRAGVLGDGGYVRVFRVSAGDSRGVSEPEAVHKEIDVPAQRIGEIVAGKRAITADTDLRLCRFFGLSNGYWLRAQVAHDTEVAAKALAPVLRRIRPWDSTAA